MKKIYPEEINIDYLKLYDIAIHVSSKEDAKALFEIFNQKDFHWAIGGRIDPFTDVHSRYHDGSNTYGFFFGFKGSTSASWKDLRYIVKEFVNAPLYSNLDL